MSADTMIGRTLADRYRIESLIGEGQMARVYEAEQLSVGRRVAVKLLRSELLSDSDPLSRFRREVEAVARLQSPHTIEFYDFGETDDGYLFVAMELLRGETLRDRLERDSRIAPIKAAAIVAQIACSLEEAHRSGVLHRDLKPENIFFCDQPTPIRPFVKVLDFGLAKIYESRDQLKLTDEKSTVGTPAYMAPENAVNERSVDHRADLYSLGVIAFEMLVGARPFSGKTPIAMMMAHVQEPVPSAYALAPDLPRGLDAFMSLALAKDAEERLESGLIFARALSAALGDRRQG